MVIVHVEHFLNKNGNEYFPDWIQEAANTLKGFKGFISISHLESMNSPKENHLLLKFENEPLLRKWSESNEHDELIYKLAPFRNKKQSSQIFRQTAIFTNSSLFNL